MKTLLTTGLVAAAIMLGGVDFSSAVESPYQATRSGTPTNVSKCRTPSDYAWMIKTGRCPG